MKLFNLSFNIPFMISLLYKIRITLTDNVSLSKYLYFVRGRF